jgi:hypothetical protein
MKCFISAADGCTPATVDWKGTANLLGVFNQTTQSKLDLKGSAPGGKCSFSDRTIDVELTMTTQAEQAATARGATAAQIQEQLSAAAAQAKEAIGAIITCTFSKSYLVQMLTNWEAGLLKSSDLQSGSCTTRG